MRHENNHAEFVSLDLGKPKDVDVNGALSIVVAQHPFHFYKKKDWLLHEEKCDNKIIVHKENFQRLASSA